MNDGKKQYDVLSFEVTAIPDADWEELRLEWEENDRFQTSQSPFKAHMEKRDSKTVHYTTEYWFDITSFYYGNLKKTPNKRF